MNTTPGYTRSAWIRDIGARASGPRCWSIDSTGHGSAKLDALAAHRTQIAIDGPFFALSNLLGREVLAIEHFRLMRGELGPDRDERGWETDLFSGIAL